MRWFLAILLPTCLVADEVSLGDLRLLRDFFRKPSNSLVFETPEIQQWMLSLGGLKLESMPGLLKQTHQLLRHKILTDEQANTVLAWVDYKYPVTQLSLDSVTQAWVTQWKLQRLHNRLWAAQQLAFNEQELLVSSAPKLRRAIICRELFRGQGKLSPSVQIAWQDIVARNKHFPQGLWKESHGQLGRDWELFLAGHGPAPSGLESELRSGITACQDYELTVLQPDPPHNMEDYLRAWTRYQGMRKLLKQASSKAPYAEILNWYLDQPIVVHWNHLVIAYLSRWHQGGPHVITAMVDDFAVPAPELVEYLLSKPNLWLYDQIQQPVIVPIASWLLLQPRLPDNIAGLNAMATSTLRAKDYPQVIELGRKAKLAMQSPLLEEWGTLTMLRGFLGAGSYESAYQIAQGIQATGGFREYPYTEALPYIQAAFYLSGDIKAAYTTSWEFYALSPGKADLAFLCEMASKSNCDYAAQFLRRLTK